MSNCDKVLVQQYWSNKFSSRYNRELFLYGAKQPAYGTKQSFTLDGQYLHIEHMQNPICKKKISRMSIESDVSFFLVAFWLVFQQLSFSTGWFVFSNSNKPNEVIMIISFNECPVLIEEQSILGFRVSVLHVFHDSRGPPALVVVLYWPCGPNITLRAQILPTDQSWTSIVYSVSFRKHTFMLSQALIQPLSEN